MSGKHRKVSREEKLRRRMQRGDTALAHGICRECSRRRIIIAPARLCERCLMQKIADDGYEGPTRQQQLDAIDEVFGTDEVERDFTLTHEGVDPDVD